MNQKSFSEVMERFINIQIDEAFDIIVAIANGGIVPAGIINQRLNIDFQTIKINLRDANQQPKFDQPQLLCPIDFDLKIKKSCWLTIASKPVQLLIWLRNSWKKQN